MTYVYQYNIAAAAIAGLLLLMYLFSRNYPTRTRKMFFGLLICTIVTAVLDVVFCTVSDLLPAWCNNLVKIFFFLGNNYCVQFFYLYVLSITRGGGNLFHLSRKVNRSFATVMMVILALLVGTSPLTHWIFYFENGVYCRGDLHFLLHLITAVTLLYCILIFVHCRAMLSCFQTVSIVLFLVGVIVTVLLQMELPTLRISMFSSALGTLLIFASLERPADYMYRNTPCYNRTAFFEYVHTHADERFFAVIVTPDNVDYLGRTLSAEAWQYALKSMIRDLHTVFGQTRVFYLDDLSFAVITEGDPMRDVVERSLGSDPIRSGSETHFQFCILPFPLLAADTDKLRETVTTLIHHPEKRLQPVYTVTPEELAKTDRQVLVLHAVRRALDEKSFQVYYQPILDAATGKYRSAEALIRLYDNDLGFIPPDEFIPIAEQNGLIVPIGEFVLDAVCAFWRENRLEDLGVSFLEVNLSTLQCMQRDVPVRLLHILQANGMDARRINLEITETAVASDQTVMLHNMNDLIREGTAFSLDDYGTGHSNIDYLASLPIEIVKIDKSILWKAMENKNSRVILEHTLRMMRDLGLKTVAEGVETPEMEALLRKTECDYYQGYLFSRPLPGAEYLGFLHEHKAC